MTNAFIDSSTDADLTNNHSDTDDKSNLLINIQDPKLYEYLAKLEGLPSFPEILRELDEVIFSDKANVRHVSNIIQRDPGLVTRILKLVNSPYIGFSGNVVSSIREAITLLGLNSVRHLVLTAKLYDDVQQNDWRGFSFDHLHQRSIQVSQLATSICHRMGQSREIQAQARIAGLLLDIGMMVLAKNDAKQYHLVMMRSLELNQPTYAVEKLMLGVTHAQIGAYLLNQWNLAPEVVCAVLHHHTPCASEDTNFSPLTAVHLADSLLPKLYNVMGVNMGGRVSRDYLQRLGLLEELPKWEMAAHDVARVLKS